MHRFWGFVVVGFGLIILAGCVPPPAAQFLVVDSTRDTLDENPGDGICADAFGECSLRAAVMEANADPSTTEIQLTGGWIYTLTIEGPPEDGAESGDLDLLANTYIRTTSGIGLATISGGGIDRVIDVVGGTQHFIEGVEITNGVSFGGGGGGVRVQSGLVGIEDTRITSNWAEYGGGVAAIGGTVWIEDSTIDGNTANLGGGALWVTSNAYVFQTTIAYNGSGPGSQIGVDIAGQGRLTLESSTVSPARALNLIAGKATITSTILDGQTGCVIAPGFGTLSSGGHNLTTDASCGLTSTGDQENTAADLRELLSTGGPVPTLLPKPGSAAIDAAECSASRPLDARQQMRPSTGCDIGAVEAQASELVIGADCTVPPSVFPGADLRNCDLTGVNLFNADLSGTNLSGALLGPTLYAIDVAGADLTNVDLSNSIIWGATSGGTTGTPAALPYGWRLTGGYLIGPKADLSNADLSTADLTGVRSGDIVGTPLSFPPGWQLTDGYLIGPGADLYDAHLAGADLTNANLAGADLGDTFLSGANFSGADLTGARIVSVILDNADFTGAVLTGITTGSISGTPAAMPTNWQLVDNHFVGPGANLDDAYLRFGDLSGVDLSGASARYSVFARADLTNANLTGVDFGFADLSEADLTGADISGVLWIHTICPDETNSADNGDTCVGHL